MEFQTKLIEKKKNPRARVAIVGVVLLMAAGILSTQRGYEHVTLWAFGVGMVVLIGGVIYAKGDLTSVQLTDRDLLIDLSEIRIAGTSYPVAQIEGLEISVEGYDGMVLYNSSQSNRPTCSNGLDNYLSFVYSGQKVECRFYMPDALHVQLLGGVYKEWYAARIPFKEEVDGSRSFLFEPVTHQRWEDLMIENGYK